ncbi:MAG: hypothetical protein HOV87_10535 [Catenulispora sp.]|nr:hypothetical protein [Catenulispora sp.]
MDGTVPERLGSRAARGRVELKCIATMCSENTGFVAGADPFPHQTAANPAMDFHEDCLKYFA